MDNCKFILASVSEGISILEKQDDFINKMNPLEYSMKLGVRHAVNLDEYVSFLKENVLSWNQTEAERLKGIISNINKILSNYNISFNYSIYLIKTTGNEEWNSAYSRSNAIILPRKKLECYDDDNLLKLIIHEFCHAFLRYRSDLKRLLYESIGFKIINEINLPNNLMSRKLTNPDAPFLNCCIQVNYRNEDINVVPITILKEGQENINSNKDIFNSITMKLLAVEKSNGEWSVRNHNNDLILIDVSDVTGFFEKVGKNTDFIIHPEEIIAENFVKLVLNNPNVSSPHIISSFKYIFEHYT